jgi:hypothetical protein
MRSGDVVEEHGLSIIYIEFQPTGMYCIERGMR